MNFPDPDYDESYLLAAAKIDSYGKSAPPLQTLPPVDSYAIAEEKDGTDEKVELLDWANGSSLNDKIEQISIQLDDNCNTSYHKTACIEKSTTSVVNECKPKDQPEEILSGRMEQLNMTKNKEETRVMEPPFKYKRFDLRSGKFSAIIVDASFINRGFVGCLALTDLDQLYSVRKEIWGLKLSDEPYTPKLGEYCIVKNEGNWFRAKVHQMVDDNHFILFCVDYAREVVVTPSEIRPYPLHIKRDCLTNLCFIHGLPKEMSPELARTLREKIKRDIILIDHIMDVTENTAGIKSVELLNKIRTFSLQKC